MIRALIHSIKEKESNGNSTQADYHRIIIATMPYFLYGTDNTFLPEFLTKGSMPIYLLSRVETVVEQEYGKLERRALYTGRREERSAWPSFLTEARNLADSYKNRDNKLWIIATRGFNFCAFRYNSMDYLDRGSFSNLDPLNLGGWTKEDLAKAKIEYLVAPDNPDIITVINWRLDNPEHQIIINNMLYYISKFNS